jgi:hypothetical protein
MVDGIPPSLRGSVDFVASGGISTRGQGVKHVGIFVDTRLTFWFGENPLGFEWGLHGFGDGIYVFVLGLHTHKESLI